MAETVHQKLKDSEDSYRNETFWNIHPLFLLVQNGETETLKENLHFHLDAFPEGRITRDKRKQLVYLAVSLVNTFMIAAIQGGVYPPDANAVADHALRQLSRLRLIEDIPRLVSDAAVELCEMARAAKHEDTGNIHVENAKHYLSDHLTQEIRMEEAAKAAGVSLYHLSRLFKALTGMTMREYLQNERIEAAKRLLVSDEAAIPQIASLLRFCDQSYFTKVFHNKTGMTPMEYRNRNLK